LSTYNNGKLNEQKWLHTVCCKKGIAHEDSVETVVAAHLCGVPAKLVRSCFNFIFHFSNQKHITAKNYSEWKRDLSILETIAAYKLLL